jgi:pyrroline-5-carboxylate reductase
MRVTVVGVGSLGSALVRGLIGKRIVRPENLRLYNRTMTDYLKQLKGEGFKVQGPKLSDECADPCDVLIFAVKPQESEGAVRPWVNSVSSTTLVISMMAGVRIEVLSRFLNAHSMIVRAMPNLGATIEKSATAYFARTPVIEANDRTIQSILAAFGSVYQLLEEEIIDGATAIAGSGPAYVCWLAERMIAAAEDFGFEREQARQLVIQTILGTAELLAEREIEPSTLRELVTSRGGTTEAALATLSAGNGEELFMRAFAAAKERAAELSNALSRTQQ